MVTKLQSDMRLYSVILLLLLLIGCANKEQRKGQSIAQVENAFESLISEIINREVFISDSLSNALNELLSKQGNYMYFVDDTVSLKEQTLVITVNPSLNLKESQYHLNAYEICIISKDSIIIDGLPGKLENNKQLFSHFLRSKSEKYQYLMKSETSDPNRLPIAHIGIYFQDQGLSREEWEIVFLSIHQINGVYKNVKSQNPLPPLRILLNFEMDYCSKFLLPEDLKIDN